jgi:hypothetical protein
MRRLINLGQTTWQLLRAEQASACGRGLTTKKKFSLQFFVFFVCFVVKCQTALLLTLGPVKP